MPTPLTLLPVRVQIKENWADPWVTVDNVEPLGASIGAAGVGSCQFRVRYGSVKFPGTSSIATVDHSQINRQWIRVLRSPYGTTDILFQGRIEADTRQVFGAASGVQTFTAYDGTQILAKTEFQKSYYWHNSAIAEMDDLLSFNLHPTSLQTTLNRTNAKHNGSYIFRLKGESWGVSDAIEYIIKQMVEDASGPTWTITGTIDVDIETFRIEGKTTALSLIQRIMASSTGYSFVVLPKDDGFELKVFSLAVDETTFGSVTIPANPDTVTISNATDPEIELRLEESSVNQYSRIELRGNRMVVCRSFYSASDELLEEPADPDRATLITAYLAATDEERQEEEYANLWCRFVASLENAAWPAAKNPMLEDDGTVDTLTAAPIPVFSGSLDALPLRAGNDNSSGASVAQEGEYLPPLLFLQDADDNYVEFRNSLVDGELLALAETIGVHIRTDLPHVMAGGEVTAVEVGGDIEPTYKSSTVVLTIAYQTSQRLRRVSGTGNETIVIEVPDAEIWFLATDTVIGISGGTGRKYTGPGQVIRDDGDKLDRLMAGAIARYLSPRGKAAGTARGLFAWHTDIGKVVATDDPDIQSILTSVSWTFENEFRTSFDSGFTL